MPPFRPGTNVITEETAPPLSAPTGTGTWFVVGLAEKGPVGEAILLQSLSDVKRLIGNKVSYSYIYDVLEHHFNEGGNTVWFSRVTGPDAVKASFTFQDADAADTLTAEAKAAGLAGNSINVTITVSGGNFTITATDGVTTETGTFADKTAAFNWATFSTLINLVDEDPTKGDPVAHPSVALAGGDDDRAGITTAEWQTALDALNDDLGAGQISAPGITDEDILNLVGDAAAEHGRVAIFDLPNTTDAATLLAAAEALSADGSYSAAFAPWLTIPSTTAGVARVVPPSGLIAGLVARNDPVIGPNSPSAGGNGISLYATGVMGSWTPQERQTLNAAGINIIRNMFQGRQRRVYGWRSLDTTDDNWSSFGNARLRMALTAEGYSVLENFMFDPIDGAGGLFNELASALGGMMQPYWVSGQLYGRSANEAFLIDVGSQVNTSDTIANKEIHAVIRYRDSPFVEYAELTFVKRPITLAV